MKLSLFKLTILAVLILTTTAYSQQQGLSFNFFGGGARSEGMGQAYIAVSDDGTAGSWNPAGLHVHEKTFMAFSYSTLMPRGAYNFFSYTNNPTVYDHEGNISGVNEWSLITPMRIKNHHFVFNLSYTRNFDVYYRFAEKIYPWSDYDASDPTDDEEANAFMERKGGVNSINLGFGTRIYDKLSFGAMANIYWGRVVSEEYRTVRIDTVLEVGSVLAEGDFLMIDSTSYGGFNVNLGLLYSGEKFRAGLLAKLPFDLKGESDSTLMWRSTLNGVTFDEIGTVFRTQIAYIDNVTSKMHMPLMLGLGLAYNINDNWLWSVDVEYRRFEGSIINNLDSLLVTASGDIEYYYSDFDPNWSDVLQLRVGTEYTFNTPLGLVPVRAGFRNEAFPEGNIGEYSITYEGPKGPSGQSVFQDSTRVYYHYEYDDKQITGYSVGVGTGIHWSQIMLDVAYTYSYYSQKIYRAEGDLRSSNYWNNHHLNFTFTGYF